MDFCRRGREVNSLSRVTHLRARFQWLIRNAGTPTTTTTSGTIRGAKAGLICASLFWPQRLLAQLRTAPAVSNHPGRALSEMAVILIVLAACSAVTLVAWLRIHALTRLSRRAEREANEIIRETNRVTDHLLQGVQGLLLTFHVAAQKISSGHASKQILDHALLEGDELVSSGRRNFERIAFRSVASKPLNAKRAGSHNAAENSSNVPF